MSVTRKNLASNDAKMRPSVPGDRRYWQSGGEKNLLGKRKRGLLAIRKTRLIARRLKIHGDDSMVVVECRWLGRKIQETQWYICNLLLVVCGYLLYGML